MVQHWGCNPGLANYKSMDSGMRLCAGVVKLVRCGLGAAGSHLGLTGGRACLRRKPIQTIAELRAHPWQHHLTPHLEPAKTDAPEFFCFKDPINLLLCLSCFQVGFYSFQLRVFTNIRILHLERRKRDALLVTPGIPEGMGSRTGILHFLHGAPSEHST